jgi:uncharacterized protein YjbI with pentapeptide repeats
LLSAYVYGSSFARANFTDAMLAGIIMHGGSLVNADLTRATLTTIVMRNGQQVEITAQFPGVVR